MATMKPWSENSAIAPVARIVAITPRTRPEDDERDRRIAAAERQVNEIAQQAAAQIQEVLMAFPLVDGTQLEGRDDAR